MKFKSFYLNSANDVLNDSKVNNWLQTVGPISLIRVEFRDCVLLIFYCDRKGKLESLETDEQSQT